MPTTQFGRELIIEADLATAEEAAVAAIERVAAGERAADMTADVEAGPVVHLHDRRRRRRRLGDRAHVGCNSRRRNRHQTGGREKKTFHLITTLRDLRRGAQPRPNINKQSGGDLVSWR